MKENEKNAHNAFVEIFRKKYCEELEFVRIPDEENRKTKDIDLIMKSCHKKYAIEHTIIEAYIGQKEYVHKSFDVVREINKKCREKLPKNNYFLLLLPYTLTNSQKEKSDFDKLANEMTDWIVTVAPYLKTEESEICFYNREKVTLLCKNDIESLFGNVFRAPTAPDNCEELTIKRFEKVIDDKLGKLSKYKLRNYQTVLLIEDISGSFSFGIPVKNVGMLDKLKIWLFVDYIIILESYMNEMITGKIWKEKWQWYKMIPYKNRFLINC